MNSYDIINNLLKELDYQKVELVGSEVKVEFDVRLYRASDGQGRPPSPTIQVLSMPKGTKFFVKSYDDGVLIRDGRGIECVVTCLESLIVISTMTAPGATYICDLSDPNSLDNLKFVLM